MTGRLAAAPVRLQGLGTDVQHPKSKCGQNPEGKTMDQTEERLAKLEEHAAHQARVIEELSDQLARQWKIVDSMRQKLDRLTERFLALEEASIENHPVTRPPHF